MFNIGINEIVLSPGEYNLDNIVNVDGIGDVSISSKTKCAKDVVINIQHNEFTAFHIKNINSFKFHNITIKILNNDENCNEITKCFIIENCNEISIHDSIIICENTKHGECIIIKDTRKENKKNDNYVWIYNMIIKKDTYGDGILIIKKSNLSITDNQITGCKFTLQECNNGTIRKNKIKNSYSDGFKLENCNNFNINKNYIRNVYDQGIAIKNNGYNRNIGNKYDIEVKNNKIIYQLNPRNYHENINNEAVGICLVNISKTYVKNNIIFANNGSGILLRGNYDKYTEGNIIEDNEINIHVKDYLGFYNKMHFADRIKWFDSIVLAEYTRENTITKNYIGCNPSTRVINFHNDDTDINNNKMGNNYNNVINYNNFYLKYAGIIHTINDIVQINSPIVLNNKVSSNIVTNVKKINICNLNKI